jgi:hypothetical protein
VQNKKQKILCRYLSKDPEGAMRAWVVGDSESSIHVAAVSSHHFLPMSKENDMKIAMGKESSIKAMSQSVRGQEHPHHLSRGTKYQATL